MKSVNFNCKELSYSDLHEVCKKWCEAIEKDFSPKLIIFIAKAGYPIGKIISGYFGADLTHIEAKRRGNGVKSFFGPIFRVMPNRVRNSLVARELNSKFHGKNAKRNIFVPNELASFCKERIPALLVDDSVDTGNTILQGKKAVEEILGYPVKTASLNVWSSSRVKVDYFVYKNTVIKTPMSKDSKEHSAFLKDYRSYCKQKGV